VVLFFFSQQWGFVFSADEMDFENAMGFCLFLVYVGMFTKRCWHEVECLSLMARTTTTMTFLQERTTTMMENKKSISS
jgi:hypothetical protein